jgi:hypothetical protein
VFVAIAKLREREEARRLRRDLGMPMKQIAARLNVSPASVHLWTRDIEISREHRTRNLRLAREKFAVRWIEINRRRRLAYQAEGRARARNGDALHQAGCMLYWAEGGKDRGLVSFANSDRAMVRLFWHFLRSNFAVDRHRLRVRLNVYLTNGLCLEEIENWWNEQLCLPRSCFGNHVTDHYPTSSSSRKRNKLPYGVCTLRLYDTRILQHIYGAIQEYGGFEEPRWLDGPPRLRSRP